MGTVRNRADPQGPPSPRGTLPSLSSLMNAVPVGSCPLHLTFMLTSNAWQPGGGRCALLPPILCQPVWVVSCPIATAAQREPETRAYCMVEAHRGLGAGWSVCVREYFAELEKAPTPPHPRPPGPPKLCVCQGQDGDLRNACLGMTAGERVGVLR